MFEINFPRDENQLCELFESLLFFKEAAFGSKNSKSDDFKLKEDGKMKLHGLGIVNLIFRQWWQTTWGYNNWTSFYDGETPRQEFARRCNEIKNINTHVGVELARKASRWKIVPRVFKEEDKNIYFVAEDEARRSKKLLTPPVYDCEFRSFVKWINELKEIEYSRTKKKRAYNSFEEIFRLFWDQAGANMVLNSNIKISKSKQHALIPLVQEKLTDFFCSFKAGEGNYLVTDNLIEGLWPIFMRIDNKLHTFAEMVDTNNSEQGDWKDISYSEKVFHNITLMFDKVIIFPMEIYFNGLESVWVNKENFQFKLYSTIQLLNGKLDLPHLRSEDGDQLIPDKDLLENMWFSPCSFFRSTGKVYEFFRSI